MLLEECAIGTVVCTVPQDGCYADKVGSIEKLTNCYAAETMVSREEKHLPKNA